MISEDYKLFLIDLSNVSIFVIYAGIILILNIYGFIKKKSIYNCINLWISLMLFEIHIIFRETLHNWNFNVMCDLTFLAISISLYLYVNDIEARRTVISEVFENRYKKRDKK